MAKSKQQSAGILLYNVSDTGLDVFLIQHGGPFWAGKDVGAWSIPKGEFDETETPLQAAIREFKEETGTLLQGHFITLQPVVQKAGKQVFAFALQGDIDAGAVVSNTFTMEWPPKSGMRQSFPEVAKAAWFPAHIAKQKINPAQAALVDELMQKLKAGL